MAVHRQTAPLVPSGSNSSSSRPLCAQHTYSSTHTAVKNVHRWCGVWCVAVCHSYQWYPPKGFRAGFGPVRSTAPLSPAGSVALRPYSRGVTVGVVGAATSASRCCATSSVSSLVPVRAPPTALACFLLLLLAEGSTSPAAVTSGRLAWNTSSLTGAKLPERKAAPLDLPTCPLGAASQVWILRQANLHGRIQIRVSHMPSGKSLP